MNKTIKRSAREIIFKVYKHCVLEQKAQSLLSDIDNAYQRTADMTGKSFSTVRRVVLEGTKNKGIFSTPAKHRKGRPRKELDDLDSCAIRRKIQYFYTVRKQAPTLRNLLAVLKKDLDFNGSHEHLRQLLKALGFKYLKCRPKRTALIEKPYIAAKRAEYLKIILNNRSLPEDLRKNIIYLGESYVHEAYMLKKCWQPINVPGIMHHVSKGKRYLIMHAGSEKGFIPNAMLIFTGANNSEINRYNFTKWVTDKLIPNLAQESIVVMDNAPYHSTVLNKAPTLGTEIAEIKEWLTKNKIQFDNTLRKPQLLMLVKLHKPAPIYEIDELLRAHGHTVVRLPPYHCDLNPIELIWGIAKHKIATLTEESIDIKEAAERSFKAITKDDWRKSCEHVMKIEKGYYERELTLYEDIERLVINLEDDTSTTSESDFGDFDASNSSRDEMEEVEYLNEDFLI